jgi:hypothetical protein
MFSGKNRLLCDLHLWSFEGHLRKYGGLYFATAFKPKQLGRQRIKIMVLLNVTPCNFNFGGMYCLHLQEQSDSGSPLACLDPVLLSPIQGSNSPPPHSTSHPPLFYITCHFANLGHSDPEDGSNMFLWYLVPIYSTTLHHIKEDLNLNMTWILPSNQR